jgi:DNA-binding NarL/FixJ family response regulator
VDDNPEILGMFRACLQRQGMTVVGVLQSAEGLLAAVQDQKPDVLVVDLTMPGRDPLDAVREVARTYPGVRTIVCSGYDDHATVASALAAGAVGFVSKNADIDEIVATVQRVASGQDCVPQ